MGLRAKFITSFQISLICILGFAHIANSQPYCIGRGDDPKKDFYARKMESILGRSSEIDASIATLEKRLPQIDKEIDSFKKDNLHNLFESFRHNPLIKTHPTLRATFEELKKSHYDLEQHRANMLISNGKAKIVLDDQKKDLAARTVVVHREYAQKNRQLIAGIGSEQESFTDTYPDLDDDIQELEDEFRNKRLNLTERLRKQLEPSFWGSTPTRQEVENFRKQYEQDMAALKREEAQALNPLRQKRSSMAAGYRGEVQSYRNEIAKEKKLYEAALLKLKKEGEANQESHDNKVKQAKAVYDQKAEAANAIFNAKMQNIKSALARDPNPRVREIGESDGILNAVGREKEAIKKLEEERSKIPAALAALKKEREQLTLINLWWDEQGEVADANQNEAGVCVNCENPLKRNIVSEVLRVPHLKLQCVENSIKVKKAHSPEIMCDNSDKKVGETQNICVTKKMADYTQWSLNNAIDCLSSPYDPIDPQILYRKLNNESTFRFFHAYNGGQGLMQTVTIAQEEMLGMSNGYRSEGRKFLARTMNNNPSGCGEYSSIIDFKNENKYDELARRGASNELSKLKTQYPLYNKPLFNPNDQDGCDFVSLQDGIHRNVISGIGLFMYYRTIADKDLENLYGPNIKKNPQYKKIRDLATLAYYGPSGPGGARQGLAKLLPTVQASSPNLAALKPKAFENILAANMPYIKAVQRSEATVDSYLKDEDGAQCVVR